MDTFVHIVSPSCYQNFLSLHMSYKSLRISFQRSFFWNIKLPLNTIDHPQRNNILLSFPPFKLEVSSETRPTLYTSLRLLSIWPTDIDAVIIVTSLVNHWKRNTTGPDWGVLAMSARRGNSIQIPQLSSLLKEFKNSYFHPYNLYWDEFDLLTGGLIYTIQPTGSRHSGSDSCPSTKLWEEEE